jgi:hypothetical protein
MNEEHEKTFFEKYKIYAEQKYGRVTDKEFSKHYAEYKKEHKKELTDLLKKLKEKYGMQKADWWIKKP